MSEDRLDLLRQAVRDILGALRMPDLDDTELHDLTLHIGHTGKWDILNFSHWINGVMVRA